MEDFVHIYQLFTIHQLNEYFGNNYYVAWTVAMDAPLQQLTDGRVVWLVQVALY